MNRQNFGNEEYRVAIYMRLSKDDGDKEESESIVNQRKILKSFVKENHYSLYNEYVDDGYSGTNFNRPSFKKMINDIEAGKVNMVITKNLARLGRDYIETGRYIETYFPERNVRYIAILDDVDTYLDKNCDTVAFKNIMNDFYAKETSKNVKKTKNRKKKEGFYYTAYAPFGYKKVDKEGNLEIDVVAAEIVKRIYREFLNGKGTYQIATLLNKEKVMTPGLVMEMTSVTNNLTGTTNIWRHTTIKRILTNPVYIGTIVQNKYKKISYKSKKMIKLPQDQYTITPNHHKAIIDEEVWQRVQLIFKNNKGTQIKNEDVLLKPFLYCSHCHNKMAVRSKKDKYKDKITVRRYVYCSTATAKVSNKVCFKHCSNYDRFEEIVLDKIVNVFGEYLKSSDFNSEKALEKLINSQSNKGKLIEKQEVYQNQLDAVNKKISMLYNDKLNGIIEEQDYTMFSERFITERHKLEDLIAENREEIIQFEQEYDFNKVEDKMKNIIKDIINKKQFNKEDLQILIKKIEIDKDRNVLIHFNFYELNCIGGYFNYDDCTGKAVNT